MRLGLPVLTSLLLGNPCASTSDEPTEIDWSGWVLSDLPAEDNNLVLEVGELEITLPDGTHLTDGTSTESRPGFYSMRVPTDLEIALRIIGETIHPTVWRSRTPRNHGYWVYGTLFGTDIASLDMTLSQLEELTDAEIPWRADQDGALIYGAPTLRDDLDLEAWTGVHLTALGGDGKRGTVIAIAQDAETGLTGLAGSSSGLVGPNQVVGPTILFVAYDLAAGPVRLIVEGSDGRTAVADWVAEDGDVLSAFHLSLPESD